MPIEALRSFIYIQTYQYPEFLLVYNLIAYGLVHIAYGETGIIPISRYQSNMYVGILVNIAYDEIGIRNYSDINPILDLTWIISEKI